MKIITNILKCFTITVISILPISQIKIAKTYAADDTAYVVIEKESGRVLSEHNPSTKKFMASTTKILTAITVIDNFEIEREISVPKESVGVEGSSVYLKEGDIYSVKDLLYGLMLRSGNDCAETLAITLSGSIENFSELMNATAKKCGAVNSNFTNPHGLHDDSHYTTAYDLALITRYALMNTEFSQIASCKSYTATERTSNGKCQWINKNKMLSSFDGATGVKTGFTKKAGRCLVSSAKRNGMELICVVLNQSDHYALSKGLLTDAFDKYKLVKIVDSKKFNYKIPNKGKTEYYRLSVDGDVYYPIKNNEEITAEIVLPEFLEYLPQNQAKVGEIKIYASKQLIFLQNIYTLVND